jgi:hypothetical protein
MPNGKKSEAQREIAALSLARGKTVRQAAVACGAAERTVQGWCAEDAFSNRVRELRGLLVTRIVSRLTGAGVAAVKVLSAVAGDGAQKGAVRVGAADKILSHLFKGTDFVAFEERLARLEQAARDRKGDGGNETPEQTGGAGT